MERIKEHLNDVVDPNVKLALEMTIDSTKRLRETNDNDSIYMLMIPDKILYNNRLLEDFYNVINDIKSIDRIYISEYCFNVLWIFIQKGWTYGSPSHHCAIETSEANWPAHYKMILIVRN